MADENAIRKLFDTTDELKERLVRVEASEETEQKEISELRADVKAIQAKLNQIIGKNTVAAAIYGVIGSIVSAIVAFVITSGKGS